MADFVFIRFPIFALFAVIVGYSVLSRDPAKTNQRGFYSTALPLYFLLTAVVLFAGSQKDPTHLFMDMYFPVLLHICLYDLLLLLFLPWLRRHFSAKACSALWLLPGILYLLEFYLLRPESPRWLLTIRGNWANYLPYIWLAGFLAVLGWKIVDHLLFRRRVLADAHPVMELSALQVWQRVLTEAGMAKSAVDLYTSPHVSTPLTLGLVRATARVILPPRDEAEHIFSCRFLTQEDACELNIYDKYATLWFNFPSDSMSCTYYYLPDGVDWSHLRAILERRVSE